MDTINSDTQRKIVDDVTGGGLPNPPNQNAFFETALESVFFFAGFVALAFIIYSGYLYITSQANPDKLKQARDSLLYSIIGFVIALSAFTIVNLTLGAAQG